MNKTAGTYSLNPKSLHPEIDGGKLFGSSSLT